MSDPKEGAGKPGVRGQGDAGAGKRPYATIDLKAVEVKQAESRKPTQNEGKTTPEAPKPPQPAPPRPQAEAAQKVAAAAAARSGGAQAAGTAQAAAGAATGARAPTPGAAAGKGASATANQTGAAGSQASASSSAPGTRPATPIQTKTGSSMGRFISHAAAGVIGGAIALYGAPKLAPLLRDAGLPQPPPAEIPAEITQRLAALEKQAASPPKFDPAKAAAEAASNTKKLEEMASTLASVRQRQEALAKQAAEVDARLAKEPPIAEAGNRLVKLEQQLAALASAAEAEPKNAGRIQQLAAVTNRMSDLESRMTTEISAARKAMSRDLDARIAAVTEASEAAKTGTQRIDREIGTVKSEQNRLATGIDQLKTTTERLSLTLKANQDDAALLNTTLDRMRREVEGRLNATAKPADVSSAIAPVATKLDSLEQNLAGVIRSEAERKTNAERIVLALELGNLRRTMERGAPYGRELDAVRKVAMPGIKLDALEAYRDKGVPTLPDLAREFKTISNSLIDTASETPDDSVVDRLLSGAKSFVRIRKTSHSPNDKSVEAVVGRMESALKAGNLGDVLNEAKSLSQVPPAAKTWLSRVEACQQVDSAIAAIDLALKSSLGASPAAADRKKAKP